MGKIYSVCRDNKNHITFCNVDIYLPVVNDSALTLEEVQDLMQQSPLLPRPISLLEQELTLEVMVQQLPL